MNLFNVSANQPMDESLYNGLSLQAKAELIQKQGSLIEAEDYYSFNVLVYTYDNHQVEITYDYSGTLISVEFVESAPRHGGDNLDAQLDQLLDEPTND